jgi:hypothetical protein
LELDAVEEVAFGFHILREEVLAFTVKFRLDLVSLFFLFTVFGLLLFVFLFMFICV